MATHFKGFTLESANMRVKFDPKRLNQNVDRAQFALDSRIMNDMVPYMPMTTGTLIRVTRAKSAATAGTGIVCAAAGPYGRYLYYGKVMVDEDTGKGPMKISNGPKGYVLRFKKGAKLVETERPLTYSNPRACPKWFEVAKEKNLNKWIKLVDDKLGGK